MLPAYHIVSYISRQGLWYCGPALYSGKAHNFLSTLMFNATIAAICLKKRQWEQRFQRKPINSTMRSSVCSAKRKPQSWNSIYETATMTAARQNSTRCRLIRCDGLKHQSTLFTPRTKFLFCVRFCWQVPMTCEKKFCYTFFAARNRTAIQLKYRKRR